jgi:6,7-dimethyl-8-ribityllumazine synthase
MSDRFEELRRSFEQDERQPFDHDTYEESSEDVLSALVDPTEEEAEPEPEAEPEAVEAEPEAEALEAEEPEAVAEPEPEPDVEVAPEPEPEPDAVAQHAPSGFRVPDGYATLEGTPNGSARSVGVVVSRFNGDITTRMLAQTLTALEEHGVARDAVTVVPVPGAFELPLAAMALAKTRRFACVVALGCVIRGETSHFEFIAGEAASGLQLAALETGVPVAFGVLTCENVEQAEARIERGAEVARGALEMADLFGQMRAQAR